MKTAPYGHWDSPISAEMFSGATKSNYNCDILVDGSRIYWTETRPAEKGRTVIIQWSEERGRVEMTPPEY